MGRQILHDGLSSDFWLQPGFTSIQPGFSGIYNFPGCFSFFPNPRSCILLFLCLPSWKTLGHQLMRHWDGVCAFWYKVGRTDQLLLLQNVEWFLPFQGKNFFFLKLLLFYIYILFTRRLNYLSFILRTWV